MLSTGRVTEVTPPMQGEQTARLTREQAQMVCRASIRALESGVCDSWTEADRESLRAGLLEMLSAVQRAQMQRDELVGLLIGNAVIRAVTSRSTSYAGETVGAFIDGLLAVAHRDDELSWIEFGDNGTRRIEIERDELGAVEVREMRLR